MTCKAATENSIPTNGRITYTASTILNRDVPEHHAWCAQLVGVTSGQILGLPAFGFGSTEREAMLDLGRKLKRDGKMGKLTKERDGR